MRKGSLGFWGTVAAGVATWAVVAAVGRVAGHWPSFWSGVVAIGLALVHPVPVPALVLAVLALVALGSGFVLWRTHRLHQALSPDEDAVVRVLGAYDGMKLAISQIGPLCGFTRLRSEVAVEALIGRRFVSFPRVSLGEVLYCLDSAGRRYALQKHYDRGQLQPPTQQS